MKDTLMFTIEIVEFDDMLQAEYVVPSNTLTRHDQLPVVVVFIANDATCVFVLFAIPLKVPANAV